MDERNIILHKAAYSNRQNNKDENKDIYNEPSNETLQQSTLTQ